MNSELGDLIHKINQVAIIVSYFLYLGPCSNNRYIILVQVKQAASTTRQYMPRFESYGI